MPMQYIYVPFSALNTDLRERVYFDLRYVYKYMYVCFLNYFLLFNISCNSNRISHTQDTAVYSYYMIDL
jgi:hypothetical protein